LNTYGPEPRGRSLSGFTVELEIYSGPYEWLLALILKDEVEIFEVPLRELVGLYRDSYRTSPEDPALERDTDFVDSAASLVLLKSRLLAPVPEPEGESPEEDALSPERLAEHLTRYLKVKRGAEALRERLEANAGFYATEHVLPARRGELKLKPERLTLAARRTFSRLSEPPTRHLGPITVTVQELAALIRDSLARGPLSYEELVQDMDRLRSAVTFAAALSLAAEGGLTLSQAEPFGPLTLNPAS
jgi:segregation and condensation protein A